MLYGSADGRIDSSTAAGPVVSVAGKQQLKEESPPLCHLTVPLSAHSIKRQEQVCVE